MRNAAMGLVIGSARRRAVVPAMFPLISLVFLSSCLTDCARRAAPVAAVEVNPPTAETALGGAVRLTATLRDSAGSPLSERQVTWSSDAPAVATVSDDGLVTGLGAGVAAISAVSEGQRGTATITVAAPEPGTGVVLIGAGDIASCGSKGDEATARILDESPGIVFTAGDNAYSHGTAAEFATCYEASWGRHKYRTRPSPGNHDYRTAEGAPYFAYFGSNAGPPEWGYYSYDLGEWHIVALNSEIDMAAGSAQEQWLRADLAATTNRCVLGYMHRPRFSSSSKHGSQPQTAPLFHALYDAGAELLIGGHDHTYERFAPQAPDGALDSARGLRQFVVGTGGRSHYDFASPLPNSDVRYNREWGVIKLTLYADSYSWEFIAVSRSWSDSGSAVCH